MLNGCPNPVVPVRVALRKVTRLIFGIKRHFEDMFTLSLSCVAFFFFPAVEVRDKVKIAFQQSLVTHPSFCLVKGKSGRKVDEDEEMER